MQTEFTFPLTFRARPPAEHIVQTHNLARFGAVVEKAVNAGGPCWHIRIVTDRPGDVAEYLMKRMPGVHWAHIP